MLGIVQSQSCPRKLEIKADQFGIWHTASRFVPTPPVFANDIRHPEGKNTFATVATFAGVKMDTKSNANSIMRGSANLARKANRSIHYNKDDAPRYSLPNNSWATVPMAWYTPMDTTLFRNQVLRKPDRDICIPIDTIRCKCPCTRVNSRSARRQQHTWWCCPCWNHKQK